ncbi:MULTISPECIES: hypothetical protein [Streptomyces]|uniref:Uncharacterized protein n=2 Tax=Streptomyces TaxID=1883 RepID=A0ABV9IJJ8_9ACTN
MSHRPYPNTDRALRQLTRHDDETPPIPAASLRPVTPLEWKLFDGLTAVTQAAGAALAESLMRALPAAGEYRLSTRPGVVSGGK